MKSRRRKELIRSQREKASKSWFSENQTKVKKFFGSFINEIPTSKSLFYRFFCFGAGGDLIQFFIYIDLVSVRELSSRVWNEK
jgi:hypothetical protein